MKKVISVIMIVLGSIVLIGAAIFRLRFYGNGASSISIIGGADGPTSVFLAGKVGTGLEGLLLLAVLFIIVGILLIIKRKKK